MNYSSGVKTKNSLDKVMVPFANKLKVKSDPKLLEEMGRFMSEQQA